MKKLICSAMSAIMALSLCVPALAANETVVYSQTEIAEMTVSEFAEAYENDTSLAPQFEKAVVDAAFLRSHITDDAAIENLSINDLDTLASIVETNSLTTREADNLVNTWQTCERVTSDTEVDYEYAEMLRMRYETQDPGISPFSYNESVTPYPNKEDGTGVHYMVRSSSGYNKASGTFTLPTLNIKSSTTDPDVPYGFFGIYVGSNSDLGFDLGTGYKQATGKWFFVINGYAKNASGNYAHYWRELSGKTFSSGSISKVNFVASITKGSAYDTLTLAIVDASNWTSIGVITLNTCDVGHDGYAGASRSYVSTDFSNVYMNREVTLAHKYQDYRSVTGTTIVGAKWSDVYLYNLSTYSKWGTAQTQFARKIGQDSTYANMVNVTVTTKWSDDTTNIYYR